MKTIFKILRSIVTSLLFLLLVFAISVHFTFTIIQCLPKRLSDTLNRDTILASLSQESLDEETKELAKNYIDDYISFVFYKRSYPSIQTVDYTRIPEENIPHARQIIEEINKKIDIDYENVIKIRTVTGFLENGSIYLLVNIGVLVSFLLLTITRFDFKKSFFGLGASLILGAILSLIGSVILASSLNSLLPENVYILLNSGVTDELLSRIHAQAIAYIIIGIITLLITLVLQRTASSKDK